MRVISRRPIHPTGHTIQRINQPIRPPHNHPITRIRANSQITKLTYSNLNRNSVTNNRHLSLQLRPTFHNQINPPHTPFGLYHRLESPQIFTTYGPHHGSQRKKRNSTDPRQQRLNNRFTSRLPSRRVTGKPILRTHRHIISQVRRHNINILDNLLRKDDRSKHSVHKHLTRRNSLSRSRQLTLITK